MSTGVRAGRLCIPLLAAVVLAAPASAQALALKADHPETGWVRLSVSGGDVSTVTLAEQVGDQQQPIADVTPKAGSVVVRHAEIWRCDRRLRHFVASQARPDGTTQTATADVRTPSCRKRLALSASARRGRVSVRLVDRWGVGDVPARACVSSPGSKLRCRSLRIPGGRKQARLAYRAHSPGLWSVVLQTAWKQGATERVYVRPSRKLRLLATGDSMIEYVDIDLKDKLGRRGFKVRSDPHVSTGLSKPFLLNWPKLAKRQARSRPDVTVVFIGANDGFPFGNVDCCGDDWVNAYATRAQSMMSAYSRQGRGLVYWLTLPAPRPAQWRPIYPAVNRALKRAAAGFAGRVRIVDIAKVVSPGFRFRSTMVWHGRRLTVRQADGVHLSQAGAAIAESLIQRALVEDGVLSGHASRAAAHASAAATIVPQRGIAGVRLDMSEQQVRDKLGAPDAVRHPTSPIFGRYTSLVYGKTRVDIFKGKAGKVFNISTTSKAEKTASGVGVGSTAAALKKGLKNEHCESRHCYVGRFEPGGKVTDFILSKAGRVTRVTVGYVID